MSRNESYCEAHYEGGQMVVVSHSPSPSLRSAGEYSVDDVVSQPEIRYHQNRDIYHDDRMYDPPSKVCGGAVFSKLMSIGTKKHDKRKKKTHNYFDDLPVTSSRSRHNTTGHTGEYIVTNHCHSGKNHILPTSTTMSSMSSTISSHNNNYTPHCNVSNGSAEHTPSLQDIHSLLNEIKHINSNIIKGKAASVSSGSEDNYKCRSDREGARSLDSRDEETIEKLKTERTFYQSEATALRMEIGGIKEELSELRKFLKDFSKAKDSGNDRQPLDGLVQNNSETRLVVSNVNENVRFFPPDENFFPSEFSSASSDLENTRPTQEPVKNSQAEYYKHDDLFSSLEDGSKSFGGNEGDLDNKRTEGRAPVEQPIPVYAASKAKKFSQDILKITRAEDNTDNAAKNDGNALDKSEKTSNNTDRAKEATKTLNVSVDSDSLTNEKKKEPNEMGNNSTRGRSTLSSRAQHARRFRARTVSPMRRRTNFSPRSSQNKENKNAADESTRTYRRPNSRLSNSSNASVLSTNESVSSEAASLPTVGQATGVKVQAEARDDIEKSDRSIHSERDDCRDEDLAQAKNFYRSYRPVTRQREMGSHRTPKPTVTPSHEVDLKAADRKYRELQRSKYQQHETSNKKDRDESPKEKLNDPDNYFLELRRKPIRPPSPEPGTEERSSYTRPREHYVGSHFAADDFHPTQHHSMPISPSPRVYAGATSPRSPFPRPPRKPFS